MKNLEIRTVEHKGVKVAMKIDFDKGEASIVEWVENSCKYDPKQWIFKNRGLEYMDGWDNILDALKFVVKECKRELELHLAQKSKFKDEIVDHVLKEIIKKKK